MMANQEFAGSNPESGVNHKDSAGRREEYEPVRVIHITPVRLKLEENQLVSIST